MKEPQRRTESSVKCPGHLPSLPPASLMGVETRSRCGPVPWHSNMLSPWQVLTAISGRGAIRRKREQVTPPKLQCGKGPGICPKAG